MIPRLNKAALSSEAPNRTENKMIFNDLLNELEEMRLELMQINERFYRYILNMKTEEQLHSEFCDVIGDESNSHS